MTKFTIYFAAFVHSSEIDSFMDFSACNSNNGVLVSAAGKYKKIYLTPIKLL